MSQPGITTEQIDNDSLFPVGNGGQVQSVFGVIESAIAVTGTIPFDDTTPLINEGTEIGAGPITRLSSTSSILIQFNLTIDCNSATTTVIVAIFRNDTCIGSVIVELDANNPQSLSMTHIDPTPGAGSPAFTDPITYSGRIGTNAGTELLAINATNGNVNKLGGQLHSYFVLTELK